MKFVYHYEDSVQAEQYGSEPPARVRAKYLPAKKGNLTGNPFWEALPVQKPYDSRDHYVPFPYTPTGPEGDDDERIEELDDIDDVRFPFGFQDEIQRKALRVLRRAAKDRMDMLYGESSTIVVGNRKIQQGASFLPSTAGDVGNGFCVVGFPGSMKTTSMDEFLRKFPKIIDLEFDDGRKPILIVPILHLTAPASGSLSALYDSGGRALDALMGNTEEHYCARMVAREQTVGGKEAAFASLLIAYNVLATVIDEVQELAAAGRNAKSSFHSLVTMVNKTKCGLISIGTQEAIDRVYEEWYAGDRAGEPVDTGKVCLDEELIGNSLRILFQWQWFDEKVDLNDPTVFKDILAAFMDCTGGSMRKIKALYKAANEEFIRNRRTHEITVNGAFFRDVATRRWPSLLPIMKMQQAEYEKLMTRLKNARTQEEKREAESEVERSTKKFAGLKAGMEPGDDIGVRNLIEIVEGHLRIDGKNVNSSDLEEVCHEVYTKYREKCGDPVNLASKVISRLKKGRHIRTMKPVKNLYDDAKPAKESIIDGNK